MDEVRSYVKKCRKYGMSDMHIRKTLREAGHQDFLIKQAMIGGRHSATPRSTNNLAMPVLVSVFIALVIGGIGIVAFTTDSATGITSAAVTEVQLQDENLLLLQAKESLLQERIKEIQSLDVSLEEKERLIAEQRYEIDSLFMQIKQERSNNLDAGIELINNMLSKE